MIGVRITEDALCKLPLRYYPNPEKNVESLTYFITDGMYTCFWKKVCGDVKEFDIGEPILPRKRKRPARYEDGVSVPHYSDNPKSFYRQLYYECIDSIVSCIEQRFDQPGYKTYHKMEQLLMNAVHGKDYRS